MEANFSQSLLKAVHGKGAHRDLQTALQNLSYSDAQTQPPTGCHSCWELLHHMYVWQEAIVRAFQGQPVDWAEIQKVRNWPKPDDMATADQFESLKSGYLTSMADFEQIIQSTDLMVKVPAFQDMTGLDAVLSIITHNSYHIGQLVSVRRQLGIWNLPDAET
ncbi:MAG: DinB family protein [Promethearchaeota archaeon]|nr:MAG: DinB family protein [Candidatus Lokiarchaeota archaeon]